MKNWMKVVLGVALSFMVLFTCIGYAALTDTLSIFGKAEITVPEGLFIIDMQVNGSVTNLDRNVFDYVGYSTTADVDISKSGRNNNGTGSVTYQITVFNNTKQTYAYRDLYYQSALSGYNGQSYISKTAQSGKIGITTSFPNGSKVEPGETLVFYATYTIGSGLNRNTNWKTLVNYRFGINVDSVEEARSAVLDKFLNILNSTATYETLYDRIDDKFTGAEWTSNYIGNVTDSSSDDSTTVNTLFAGQLQMVINGEENPITVLIKHENVDGNQNTGDDYTATYGNAVFNGYGCEFTLYMTTSDLSDRNADPPVYAAVYTCDRNEDGTLGSWYLLGDPYYGTAQIVGYEGGESTGSFDTGTWRSYAETYAPSENYSYTVSAGQTIQQVIQTKDPAANAALETLLAQAKKILDDNIYAGTGMEALEETYFAYMEAGKLYSVGADGTITVNSDATRAQITPHLGSIASALKAFEGLQP